MPGKACWVLWRTNFEIDQHYQPIKAIGKGAYGVVCRWGVRPAQGATQHAFARARPGSSTGAAVIAVLAPARAQQQAHRTLERLSAPAAYWRGALGAGCCRGLAPASPRILAHPPTQRHRMRPPARAAPRTW